MLVLWHPNSAWPLSQPRPLISFWFKQALKPAGFKGWCRASWKWFQIGHQHPVGGKWVLEFLASHQLFIWSLTQLISIISFCDVSHHVFLFGIYSHFSLTHLPSLFPNPPSTHKTKFLSKPKQFLVTGFILSILRKLTFTPHSPLPWLEGSGWGMHPGTQKWGTLH